MNILSKPITRVTEVRVPSLRIKKLTLKSRRDNRIVVSTGTCEDSCCTKTYHTQIG